MLDTLTPAARSSFEGSCTKEGQLGLVESTGEARVCLDGTWGPLQAGTVADPGLQPRGYFGASVNAPLRTTRTKVSLDTAHFAEGISMDMGGLVFARTGNYAVTLCAPVHDMGNVWWTVGMWKNDMHHMVAAANAVGSQGNSDSFPMCMEFGMAVDSTSARYYPAIITNRNQAWGSYGVLTKPNSPFDAAYVLTAAIYYIPDDTPFAYLTRHTGITINSNQMLLPTDTVTLSNGITLESNLVKVTDAGKYKAVNGIRSEDIADVWTTHECHADGTLSVTGFKGVGFGMTGGDDQGQFMTTIAVDMPTNGKFGCGIRKDNGGTGSIHSPTLISGFEYSHSQFVKKFGSSYAVYRQQSGVSQLNAAVVDAGVGLMPFSHTIYEQGITRSGDSFSFSQPGMYWVWWGYRPGNAQHAGKWIQYCIYDVDDKICVGKSVGYTSWSDRHDPGLESAAWMIQVHDTSHTYRLGILRSNAETWDWGVATPVLGFAYDLVVDRVGDVANP